LPDPRCPSAPLRAGTFDSAPSYVPLSGTTEDKQGRPGGCPSREEGFLVYSLGAQRKPRRRSRSTGRRQATSGSRHSTPCPAKRDRLSTDSAISHICPAKRDSPSVLACEARSSSAFSAFSAVNSRPPSVRSRPPSEPLALCPPHLPYPISHLPSRSAGLPRPPISHLLSSTIVPPSGIYRPLRASHLPSTISHAHRAFVIRPRVRSTLLLRVLCVLAGKFWSPQAGSPLTLRPPLSALRKTAPPSGSLASSPF